jgi:iron(III) transport system permease protein
VRERLGLPHGLLALCLAVAVLVTLPVVVTIVQAVQGGFAALSTALRAPATGTLMLHSLEVAALATLVATVIGVATAWFIERTRLPLRRLWAVLLIVPLTIPPFLTSYAWASLGTSLQGFWGASGLIAFTYYPIVFLLVAVGIRGLDPALEETARSLGLNGPKTFFRVVLPQLRPALLGGMLLVALDTLIEFDAFVGLRFQTFSSDVYAQYKLGFSASGAAALSFASIAVCVVLLLGEARLRGHANYTRVSHGASRRPEPYELGWAAVPVLGGLAGLVAVSVGIPIGAMVDWYSTSSRAALSSAGGNLQYLWPATLTSLELSVSAALLAVLLALPVSLAAVRYRSRAVTLLERSTYLSFALPDLVAAIALAYAASHWAGALYGTFGLLVLAEAILFLPFAVVALRATLGQLEPALEDSARSLGSGPLGSFWRVTIPLARPGLAAAAVLVFAFSLGDLSTAQVLLPLDRYTLGTEFNVNSASVAFAAAAPFAAVLIGLALVAAYVVTSRFGRVRALAGR